MTTIREFLNRAEDEKRRRRTMRKEEFVCPMGHRFTKEEAETFGYRCPICQEGKEK